MGWEVSFNRERPGGTGVPGCLTTPQHRHGLTTDDTLLQQHRGHMICQITDISQFSDLRSYKVQINVSTRFPTARAGTSTGTAGLVSATHQRASTGAAGRTALS
jgi:hypothetical protein